MFYVRIGGQMTASDLAYFVSKCLGLGWERFLLWPDSPNHIIVLCFFSTSGHIVSALVEVFKRVFTLGVFFCAENLADIFQYTILNCALAIQRMDWGAGPRLVSCPTRWYLFHNPDKKEILHNAQQCPSPRVAWACYTMHGPRYIFQISELVQNDPLFGYNINIIWRDHNFKYGRHIRHIRQMFVIFEDFEICENIIYHVF